VAPQDIDTSANVGANIGMAVAVKAEGTPTTTTDTEPMPDTFSHLIAHSNRTEQAAGSKQQQQESVLPFDRLSNHNSVVSDRYQIYNSSSSGDKSETIGAQDAIARFPSDTATDVIRPGSLEEVSSATKQETPKRSYQPSSPTDDARRPGQQKESPLSGHRPSSCSFTTVAEHVTVGL
jgi:hypothetical protein